VAFDEFLGGRIRTALSQRSDVVEKRMFGGLAFMVAGNMAVGVIGEDLMVRVGPEANDDALSQPHARPMDFGGRPMAGYVYVAPGGVETDQMLTAWVDRGVTFATTLPAKTARPPKRRATPK
jgi:TfoX/Sxy family transcriptional regulator of competence genes